MFLDGKDGALARIEAICDTSTKVLIVLDSVAALKTMVEVEDGIDASQAVAEIARHWSRGLRILTEKVERSQCTLLLLNQTRATIGGYGASSDTSGGTAIKFYASLRLKVWPYGPKDRYQDFKQLGIEAVKNKLAKPHQAADLRFNYDSGFNERWNIINYAKDRKLIPEKSQSYKDACVALGWFDLASEIDAKPEEEAAEDTAPTAEAT
jgi:recombination protein RecA